MADECGACGRPAEVVATVPMCGERPRYPMCWECFEPINDCGYAEDVTPLLPMWATHWVGHGWHKHYEDLDKRGG